MAVGSRCEGARILMKFFLSTSPEGLRAIVALLIIFALLSFGFLYGDTSAMHLGSGE